MSDDEIFRIQAHIEAMTQDKQNAKDLLKEKQTKSMTPNIEQTARELALELQKEIPCQISYENFMRWIPPIITRHITAHTKDLEDENKRLREALQECLAIVRIQNGNLHKDINEIQERARKALTKPT